MPITKYVFSSGETLKCSVPEIARVVRLAKEVQTVGFARQVVVAIGAVAAWTFALVGYTQLQPQLRAGSPAAAEHEDSVALAQSKAAPEAEVASTAERPAAPDVPDLLGPSAERSTAKKMADIGGHLNEFWSEQFATSGTLKSHTWKPVTELYVDSDVETCGQGSNKRVGDYFCPGRYYVSLDIVQTEKDGVPSVTPSRNFIIAHEWGHAVQESAGIAMRSKQMELQADCFAGVFLQHASEHHLLAAAEADLSTMHQVVHGIGDDISTPVPGTEHGTGDQRMKSFDRGWNAGAGACLEQ